MTERDLANSKREATRCILADFGARISSLVPDVGWQVEWHSSRSREWVVTLVLSLAGQPEDELVVVTADLELETGSHTVDIIDHESMAIGEMRLDGSVSVDAMARQVRSFLDVHVAAVVEALTA